MPRRPSPPPFGRPSSRPPFGTSGARVLLGLLTLLPAVAAAAPPATQTAKRRGRFERWNGHKVVRLIFRKFKRSKAWRLRAFFDTQVGRPFDAYTFRHDLRRLRNLEMHRRVRGRVKPVKGGVAIEVTGSDQWSLIPYFDYFRGGGSWQVLLGLYDVNPFGTIFTVGLEIVVFNGHPGGVVYGEVERPFGLPLTWFGSVRVERTLRLVYGDRASLAGFFEMRRYYGFQRLYSEILPWLRVGLWEFVVHRDYRLPEDAPTPTLAAAAWPADGLTHELGLFFRLGHLAYNNYLWHGTTFEARLAFSHPGIGSRFRFVKAFAEWKGFYRFGPRGGNLAARVGAGHMSGGAFAHLFHLGSWTGLRGFRTRQLVGRSYVFGNLEYRTGLLALELPIASIIPFFRGKVLRLQGVAFVDAGGIAGGGDYRTIESGRPLVSVGAGFRAAVTKIYKAVLRVDFAVVVSPYRAFDLIIATQQYF